MAFSVVYCNFISVICEGNQSHFLFNFIKSMAKRGLPKDLKPAQQKVSFSGTELSTKAVHSMPANLLKVVSICH